MSNYVNVSPHLLRGLVPVVKLRIAHQVRDDGIKGR